MRKIFHDIHLWLAVPFGIFITLSCLTGALLVFETEIMERVQKEIYFIEYNNQKTLPADSLMVCATRQLPDSVSVTSMNISADPERAWQLNLSQPKKASVYINPYTGELTGKGGRTPFFNTVFRLHRWLLGSPSSPGKIIMGVSTIAFAVILIAAIFIWWPRSRKGLKNRVKICCNRGPKRFFYDLHVSGGIYALLFLLALALTGPTWSFDWYKKAFHTVFGVETAQNNNSAAQKSGDKGGKEKKEEAGQSASRLDKVRQSTCHWQDVYEQLAAANPSYRQIQLSDGSAKVSFNRLGNQRAADQYLFDAQSGQIIKEIPYASLDKSGKIGGWIYSVHVGSWGGVLTRILTFLAAILGMCLPGIGYYLWISRRLRKKQRRS